MATENDNNVPTLDSERGCRICASKIPDARAVREQVADARREGYQISPQLERAAFGLCSAECEAEHDKRRTLAKLHGQGIVS